MKQQFFGASWWCANASWALSTKNRCIGRKSRSTGRKSLGEITRKSQSLLKQKVNIFVANENEIIGFQIICHRSFALHRSPSGSMKNTDKTTTEFVI
jgi:hypothetical protein